MWSKTQDPEKLEDISAMKHWIQTTSINVLNSAYAKRRRKLYKNFARNTRNLRLLVSRHEAAFAYSMNVYLEEMDPSLNYSEFVTVVKRSFISSFSDHFL